jgi:sulfite reductase (NADPH) flavoprotein alpha-component
MSSSAPLVLASVSLVATTALWYWWTTHNDEDSMPTDFDSYLANPTYKTTNQEEKTKILVTDFENWIRKPDPTSVTQKLSSTETSECDEPQTAPPHLKPVGVLYGTEFGLSREICEKLCEKLQGTQRYYPMLLSMDDYPTGIDLGKFQALLVACSTQGEGVPPTDARAFCQWLQSEDAPSVKNLRFSVCALGDTSYTHFAQCGKDVDARLEHLSGSHNRICSRVDVNKEDWSAIDGWIDSVLTGLDSLELQTVEELGNPSLFDVSHKLGGVGNASVKRFSKSRPFVAEVSNVSNLCTISGSDDKKTIRVDIDLGDSGLTYVPGDSLGVWPQNNSKYVNEIIDLMGWDPEELLPRPSWHYSAVSDLETAEPQEEKKKTSDENASKMSLRELLTVCYDLKSPKPDLLIYLREQADPSVAAQIPSDSVEYLATRHVIDVLRDFQSPISQQKQEKNPSPSAILKYLRQLVPRLYSISSTPRDDPRTVTLTVAVVEYEQLGIERQGVCSTYLNDRVPKGSKIPIYVYENPDFRLPDSNETPIVMVGPGTGVAPFRSFIRHRASLGSTTKNPMDRADNILFFGSRRRDQDFLYSEELESFDKECKLALITAFSREADEKVYVQHRLVEHAGLVWEALERGGHFYICGDGEHMSGAVEAALEDLVATHQGRGREEAANYVARLAASGRLQKDVWF